MTGLSTLPAAAADLPDLMVTEIAPDIEGYDHFEFIEITNTTAVDSDLADASLAYTYADSADTGRDVALQVAEGTVVPAGGSVVLWLSYTTSTVDSFARSEQDFRDFWAGAGEPAAEYDVVRVTGQPGMANGGGRGVRVSDASGASSSWSFYPAGSVAVDRSAHFRVGDGLDAGTDLLEGPGTATPGAVDPAAFEPATPEPEPEPEPGPGPEPDPDLSTAPLQVTELLPDSRNVGSADGFEFIEVYNATSEPIDTGDYTLDYLYPGAGLVNTNVVTWASTPSSVVIPAGGTLVHWVKNGQNDELTDKDFNTAFGTDLTLGEDLVEVFTPGMANGSARGLQIVTNTGVGVNTAYYNLDGADDVAPDQGIQYATDPIDPMRQVLLGPAPASPGAVTAEQVPDGLAVPPEDTQAPQVTDHTADRIDPAASFPVEFTVTDDVQVRTVTLHLRTDVDEATTPHNLRTDGEDGYAHLVNQVDLTGKRWVEYSLEVSDGSRVSTTEVRRVPVTGADDSPVRLNLTEGEFVTGTTRVAAAGDDYPSTLELSIDGAPATPVQESLEDEPVFAFEATATDAFFRNGVLIGDDVLHIFDEGFYAEEVTVSTAVPLARVEQGQDLTLSVYAGTKAWPEIDPDENNDDFKIRNMRMVLPDGRTLRPAGYEDPTQWLEMGDSAGKLDFHDSAFTIPQDAFTAVAHEWDTTAAGDGPHEVAASDGEATAERTVQVDNTAPALTTTLEQGRRYQGEFVVDAEATDAGSGVDTLGATLDGEPVELPHTTSSLDLEAGEHTVVFSAEDAVGNTRTQEVVFSTPQEQPSGAPVGPSDGATVDEGDVLLEATVEDPTGDVLDVEFREGWTFTPADPQVTSSSGTTRVAAGTDREGAKVLSGTDLESMTGVDGLDTEVSSQDAFPYQLFEVELEEGTGSGALARVAWEGRANTGAKVLLHVLDPETDTWVEVDRALTTDGMPTRIDLGAMVPVDEYADAGRLKVLVQHSEGFAGEDLSSRTSEVMPYHPEDVDRGDYDFTLAWESDTQYYNEEFFQRQLDIHDYVLERREDINLQYLVHTGDIVDDWDQEAQWRNAEQAYTMLDEAQLPYGVLAGNHDVGGARVDYGAFGQWFGQERFGANPWYAESYQDNRGHYDLVTAGGIDFLMLYQGWGVGDAEIDWMNEVLARFPERTAVVNLHEYMLTTGGLGPVPQRIQDEVVATNPNVKVVTSGHYHDAFTRIDEFDDDGDGSPDRKVHQMLFDYQGLPEGGQSFLRLLHFDNEGEQMMVRTFSPYLDQYNSEDPTLELEHQEFEVSYADLGIEVRTKELATDAMTVDVITGSTIAAFEDVESGTSVAALWRDRPAGDSTWFVVTSDPFGGVHYSEPSTFTAEPPAGPGVDVDRVGGADRWETAAMVAAQFPDGVDTVYVTTGRAYPDALAGSARAGSGTVPGLLGTQQTAQGAAAPVLLVDTTSVPAATRRSLTALSPSRIVVLGGTGAVDEGVEEELASITGADVRRVSGKDRYETAALLAAESGPVDRVYVASGEDNAGGFADVLSGAALAADEGVPVLLTRADTVPSSVTRALTALGDPEVVVLGGEAAVTPAAYEALGGDRRLAGADRYGTSAAVAAEFDETGGEVYLATGLDYPDALTGSALAGSQSAPMLLTRPQTVPQVVLAQLDRLTPGRVVVLGGTGAVSEAVADQVRERSSTWGR